jgi:hypothetical protein
MEVVSRPEVRLANSLREHLSSPADQDTFAQWLMDEGSVGVCYFARGDITILLVCGSMNDFEVLGRISGILGVPITSSKVPTTTSLPVGAVRVQNGRAYALLQLLLPRLLGLKLAEATAALEFFPPSGRVKGRHTTDEFLTSVWRDHARRTLLEWDRLRVVKHSADDLKMWADDWVKGRIRRARRFVDRAASESGPVSNNMTS